MKATKTIAEELLGKMPKNGEAPTARNTITPAKLPVLRYVLDNPRTTKKKVASALGLTDGQANGKLFFLVSNGFVKIDKTVYPAQYTYLKGLFKDEN